MVKNRFMRVLVMFDLPVTLDRHKKAYRKFRKWLIETGFIMMQESVYSKIVLNHTAAKFLIKQLQDRKVEEGLIQVLVVTEKQFASIECIVGSVSSEIVNDMERLVVL